MGNCCGSPSTEPTPSFPGTSTQVNEVPSSKFSVSGTSDNTSNDGGLSITSSSAGNSRLSAAPASESHDEAFPEGQILPTPNLKIFSFADLKTATRNFKSDNVLGIGGFGTVFKGSVDEKTLAPCKAGTGMVVAIKKLNPESLQGFQEWQAVAIGNGLQFIVVGLYQRMGTKRGSFSVGTVILPVSEVNFLGRLSHPNLVKLLGYCWDDKELLLVYEFMQKGSLENHLFRRLQCKNIRFCLAKLGPSGGESHVTTRVMGTYGYAAPEYIATGHLYVKSDVYGFGVVLLEMLTGLRALDTKRPNGQQSLVDWTRPSLSSKRKLKNIMDARVEGQYSPKAAFEAAQLTLKCLGSDPKSRPSMKEVVEVLEKIEAMSGKPKESRTKHSTAHHHGHQPLPLPSPRHQRHHGTAMGVQK
ncbi:putative serine/threonine-protein kinase PIX13 [Vitis vinifera]|uniref:Putative serine/threonine-protein kinase PIX13 n=1 Tax=Vitis vinifera TaxID=29760 RepID=A0A438DBT2_VITVI|nr:putative serine/threonine-protein kinase PIX13 [Vitis vinifera]